MKKLITLLCVISIAFCFTACTGNEDDTKPTNKPAITESAKPTSTPTGDSEATPTDGAAPTEGATPTEKPTEAPAVDLTGLTNIALNKPVEAFGSAYESAYWNKNFVTDGFKLEDDIEGQTTGWMSDASEDFDEETWIYVDLEEAKTIKAIAIYPRESGTYFPVAYRIEISNDLENWITVKDVSDDFGDTDEERIFGVASTEARYVRVYVTERYDNRVVMGTINGYLVEISEIEVYA